MANRNLHPAHSHPGRKCRVMRTVAIVWLALHGATTAVRAQDASPASPSPDPHAVFEQRCKGCHSEHGADLARQRLSLDAAGTLQVARSGQSVDTLLKAHHGVRLTPAEKTGLVTLMRKGLASGGVFQHRCASCHGKAVTFARDKLMLNEGTLRTRADNRRVADVLKGHGEATPTEVDTLLDILSWQLLTAPR